MFCDCEFVYDSNNVVAEYEDGTLTKKYLWGEDVSGSMDGAGGVGALLVVTNDSENYYPSYDGNSNIVNYVDENQTSVAKFEYTPFGVIKSENGSLSDQFHYRFSTKYFDNSTGLIVYRYRNYNPNTGKWQTRDPIQEQGGYNLYGFIDNDAINNYDVLGLFLGLFYGNHEVLFDNHHSKLWLITDESDFVKKSKHAFLDLVQLHPSVVKNLEKTCWYFLTIGAGPDNGISDYELVANFNREKDVIKPLNNIWFLKSYSHIQAESLLDKIDEYNHTMNNNFEDTYLEYDLFPGGSYIHKNEWFEYNSNSYISGLLQVLNIPGPGTPGANVPGYSKPVPKFVFTKQFLDTEEIKAEFKRVYGGP